MQTEDHPIEYGDFEGVIPKGEYGGGTVMLWDRGTWTPVGDPHEGLKKGRLKFTLDGEKLSGGWNLVRTRGRNGDKADGRAWLLIKERDAMPRAARRSSSKRPTAWRPAATSTKSRTRRNACGAPANRSRKT
jgi:bifunctional non-homologous end joining protein LigD